MAVSKLRAVLCSSENFVLIASGQGLGIRKRHWADQFVRRVFLKPQRILRGPSCRVRGTRENNAVSFFYPGFDGSVV